MLFRSGFDSRDSGEGYGHYAVGVPRSPAMTSRFIAELPVVVDVFVVLADRATSRGYGLPLLVCGCMRAGPHVSVA